MVGGGVTEIGTPDKGSGGRGIMKCHYCQRPVSFDIGTPSHVDDSPLCSQGSIVRWIERDVRG
jgi:hypothetical protein